MKYNIHRGVALVVFMWAVSAQAQNMMPPGNWSVLPPKEYDRPYTGQLTIARGDARTMTAICPNPGYPVPLGCAIHYLLEGKDLSCHIYIADDEILKSSGWGYGIVLRHEIGHCNSWPADHPGMRRM